MIAATPVREQLIVLFDCLHVDPSGTDAFERLNTALWEFTSNYSGPKKKRGAPRQWIARQGLEFAWKVESIIFEKQCGVAPAINALLAKERQASRRSKKAPPDWTKSTPRQLEVRFQETRKFWLPHLKEIIELVDERMGLVAEEAPYLDGLRKFLP
jgi:hypothetical protein